MANGRDRDVLDIVTALNKDLRRNEELRRWLRNCDEETARQIASSYMRWLYEVLGYKQPEEC
jgi:hypothetical protein